MCSSEHLTGVLYRLAMSLLRWKLYGVNLKTCWVQISRQTIQVQKIRLTIETEVVDDFSEISATSIQPPTTDYACRP